MKKTKVKGENPKAKFGAQKVPLGLIPPAAEFHLARAHANGAHKYGPYNWRETTVDAMTYIHAAKRHLSCFLDGEDYSQDTVEAGMPVHHLGHVMACCAILLDAQALGRLDDNRPPPGKASILIEELKGN